MCSAFLGHSLSASAQTTCSEPGQSGDGAASALLSREVEESCYPSLHTGECMLNKVSAHSTNVPMCAHLWCMLRLCPFFK